MTTEQYDQHGDRVRRTNTNWRNGMFAGLGASFLISNKGARRLTQHLVYGASVGGNVTQRVQQETGDLGLATEVGTYRAARTFAATHVFNLGLFFALIWLVAAVGAVVCVLQDRTAGLIVALVALPVLYFPARWCVRWANREFRENQRLIETGMPTEAQLRHAGYVLVGLTWVRPAPGHTVTDTLAAHGIDPGIIDTREV